MTTETAALTAPQTAALAKITERGYLGIGNGVSLPTVRALERAGLVTVEANAWSAYNHRSGHTSHGVDWMARIA